VCARVGACARALWRVLVLVHVALLMQHATRIRYLVTSFVAPPVPSYFSTLSHKLHDLLKKLLNMKCVVIFYINFV
jgi:hypothetical protein